jgi:O-glycosyl hydrolase
VADSAAQPSAAQPFAGGVSHVGFRNPDGSMVVVLTNSGEERQVQLVLGSSAGLSALEVELPADSVQTLQWS